MVLTQERGRGCVSRGGWKTSQRQSVFSREIASKLTPLGVDSVLVPVLCCV